MKKARYYLVILSFVFVWLVVSGCLVKNIVQKKIQNYWVESLTESKVKTVHDLGKFLKSRNELLKIQVGVNRSKSDLKPISKRSGIIANECFISEVIYGNYFIKLWYTHEFFLKRIDEMRKLMTVIFATLLAVGILGFVLLNQVIVFGPISDIESGKMNGRDLLGLFGRIKGNFVENLNNAQSSDIHASVLFKAAKSITSHFDFSQTIGRILDIVLERFPGATCSVTFLDDDGFLKIKNSRGLSSEFVRSMRTKRGEGYAGECIDNKKIIVIQDTDDDLHSESKELLRSENIRSFVHMPIVVENKAVGTFNVNSSSPNYFTQDAVEVITTLSEYLSIAAANSKLYDKVKDFNRRLEIEISYTTSELLKTNNKLIGKIRECRALSDILEIIRKEHLLPKAIDRVFDRLKEVVFADFYSFLFLDADSGVWRKYLQAFGYQKICDDDENSKLPLDTGKLVLLSDVIASGKAYINNEAFPELDWKFLPRDMYFKNIVMLPTFSDNVVNGVIIIANKIGDKFDDVDMDFLATVASVLSLCIERQNLLSKLLKTKN